MFQQKIDLKAATPIDGPAALVRPEGDATSRQPARLMSALVVLALPLILLWFLARLVWEDCKAAGRALRAFHQAVAEEISAGS